MSNNITLTPGKHYRTRDGKKARIYATDGASPYPVHGAKQRDGQWHCSTYMQNGRVDQYSVCDGDIVDEWIDRPEGGWEHLPPWIKWRAMDSGGNWFAFEGKPEQLTGNVCQWFNPSWKSYFAIPPAYCPNYTGPWTDSLDERPEGGK